MHYFLNYSLVDINSSIEHAALMRLKLFKQNNLPAKYVTVNWDYLNHLRVEQYGIQLSDVINMYEFFANVANISATSTPKALETLPLDSDLIWEGDGNQADVTEADIKRAHVDYTPGLVQTVGKITYQDRYGKPYRREYWDARGFLAYAEVLSAVGNVLQEILYDAVTHQPVLTRHYHVADNLVVLHQINLTYQGQLYQFKDENALITFFLQQLTQDMPATIYVDRPSLAEPVVLMGTGVKKVLMVPTLHAQDPHNQATSNLDNTYYYPIYQHLTDFDAVLVATEAQAADLRTWLGGNPTEVTSTRTPIYAVSRAVTALTPITTGQHVAGKVVYAGMLNDYEALKDIVVAFTKVQSVVPQATLTMAGFGAAYDQLKTEVAQQELPNITFVGYLNQQKLDTLLASADVFVSTQVGDSQPLAMIQALEHGTPVITYDFNYGLSSLSTSPAVQILTSRKRSILAKQLTTYLTTDDHTALYTEAQTVATTYQPATVLAAYNAATLI